MANFVTQAIDQAGVPGQMHGEVGTTTRSSAEDEDKDGALVAFKTSLHPPGSCSASNGYSAVAVAAAGWRGLHLGS